MIIDYKIYFRTTAAVNKFNDSYEWPAKNVSK